MHMICSVMHSACVYICHPYIYAMHKFTFQYIHSAICACRFTDVLWSIPAIISLQRLSETCKLHVVELFCTMVGRNSNSVGYCNYLVVSQKLTLSSSGQLTLCLQHLSSWISNGLIWILIFALHHVLDTRTNEFPLLLALGKTRV